jgi:poly(A) polymerase
MSGPKADPRESAAHIVRVLRQAGHVAYLAGGCVRDRLMGLEPKDYDVATDAKPDRVRQLFRDSRAVGEAFGVVLVRVNQTPVEVATFRTEWGYQDGRRPTNIEFSDAQHDAARRDFTINGLFEDPFPATENNRIIDYVGGQADLKAHRVRAIGDPRDRFAEDYLRMIRAVRFAARFEFQIEPETAHAIRAMAPQLSRISRERIGQEVMGMLTGPHPPLAAGMLQDLLLDGAALGEEHLNPPLSTLRAMEALTQVQLNQSDRLPDYPTWLAAWVLDRHGFIQPGDAAGLQVKSGSIDAISRQWNAFIEQKMHTIVQRWRLALVLSNDQTNAMTATIRGVGQWLNWSGLGVAARKRILSQDFINQSLTLLECVVKNVPDNREWLLSVQKESDQMILQGVHPEPFINGYDLIRMGLKPGADFRRILEKVYDKQLEGFVTSHDQAKEWIKKAIASGECT